MIHITLKRQASRNGGYYSPGEGMPYGYRFSKCQIMPREKIRTRVPWPGRQGHFFTRTEIKDAVSIPGVEIYACAKNGALKRRSKLQIAREDLDEFIAALQTIRNTIDES